MINSIKLANLRNGEYTQLLKDILSIVDQNNPGDLKVQDQYDTLKTVFGEIEKLFKVPTGNAISTELEELDARRDNAINGVTAIINGYTYSTDAAEKANAALLSNHLSTFGAGVARDNYQSETTNIRNIIADWNTQPKLSAAFANLELTTWKTELEAANNAFNERYLVRASEMGSASPESIKAKRLAGNDAYYALRDHLNAQYTINKGADPFGKTVIFINGLLENYNSLLSRRNNGTDTTDADTGGASVTTS